nr:uncharacterized protein LOC127340827 isoform X3 [Lolium perenne]
MTLQRRASWCSSHLKQGTWNNGTFVLRGQGTKRLILFPICYSEVKDPEISRAKPSSTGWADSDLFYDPSTVILWVFYLHIYYQKDEGLGTF